MDELWYLNNNYGDSSDYVNSSPTSYDYSDRKKALSDYNRTGKSTDLLGAGLAGSALAYIPKTSFSGATFDDHDAISQNLIQGGMDQNQAFTLGEMGRSGLFGEKNDPNSWSKWFGDKGNQFMVGAGLGLGQLGLGLASYLQQSDFMKKQGKLLDQQLASNQYEIDRRQGFDKRLADPNGTFATSYNAARNA